MINEKLLSFANKYRDYDLTNGMNLINIFQDLSRKYPNSLPLDSTELEQEIVKITKQLGFVPDLTKKDNNLWINSKTPHKWDSYHLQYKFGISNKYTFKIATIDRTKIALVLSDTVAKQMAETVAYKQNKTKLIFRAVLHDKLMPQYNIEVPLPYAEDNNLVDNAVKENIAKEPDLIYYFFSDDLIPESSDYNTDLISAINEYAENLQYVPIREITWLTDYNQRLADLLTLFTLSTKQNTALNNDLFGLSARLIYIQQSTLSVKTKDEQTALKHVAYDFGPATDAFIRRFRIPALKPGDYAPSIKIIDLIKYMSDVVNNRPVDSDIFNLIAKGHDMASDIIIANQAHVLNLENILSEISTTDKKNLEKKISPSVVKRINHIWKINKTDRRKDDKNTKHLTLVHGTRNLSVLNILGEGLLDSDTLEKKHSTHYTYTGSGFGRGIYFARLDQADKSYNYTEEYTNAEENKNVYGYMFIADVAYHQAKHVSYYGSTKLQDGQDLIWGDAVGSFDRDEIVAPKPEQVHLKYLIELKA